MDNDSSYMHRSHNVSMLLCHFVTPTKYRRLAITEKVEGCMWQICEGIELRWNSQRPRPLSIAEYPRPQSRRDSEADKERNGKKSICRTLRSEKDAMGRRILERRLLRVECRHIYK